VYFRAIRDHRGRIMVVMIHNTDIADSWEREGEDAAFFYQFSPDGYAVGIDKRTAPCVDALDGRSRSRFSVLASWFVFTFGSLFRVPGSGPATAGHYVGVCDVPSWVRSVRLQADRTGNLEQRTEHRT
jgi:hypothetical protein